MPELLKITPGSWLVNSSAVKANWPMDPVVVCEVARLSFVDGKKAPHEQQIANLHALASTPELYKALAFCKSVIEANGVFELSEKMAIKAADKALALAEGRYI